MIILGIDPGFSGGLVWYDSIKDEIIKMEVMPVIHSLKKKTRKVRPNDSEYGKQKTKGYVAKEPHLDIDSLNSLIMSEHFDKAFLEKVHARPFEGVVSTFRFGTTFGAILAILIVNKKSYELVAASEWTKGIHSILGIKKKKLDAKEKSELVCSKLFSGVNFVVGRSKKHDGLMDAALISYYGSINERRLMI